MAPQLATASLVFSGTLQATSGPGLAQVLHSRPVATKAYVLDDQALDGLTASGTSIFLTLNATASGPTAYTSTSGSILTNRTEVLRIKVEPNTSEGASVRLLGKSSADVAVATGQAEAAGASDAHCSAASTIVGSPQSIMRMASMTTTPTSAICACATLTLTLVP